MNPSPSAIATIQTHVATLSGGWTGNTNDQLVTTLNTPSIENPMPQPQLPKPFAFADVMGCLGSSSIANIRDLPTGIDLINKINAGDIIGIGHWIVALQAGTPLITTGEATAVAAVITATVGDPSWAAQISWAVANLGRAVDSEDIEQARPA